MIYVLIKVHIESTIHLSKDKLAGTMAAFRGGPDFHPTKQVNLFKIRLKESGLIMVDLLNDINILGKIGILKTCLVT